MTARNIIDRKPSATLSRWATRALCAAIACGPCLTASAAQLCTALTGGTWGPVSGGSVVWSCPGGTPSGDDHFIVPPGVVVSIVADVVQTGALGAGVTVQAGGVLEARVDEATGGITLGLGPAGLACQAGSTCSFRGGYREIGVPEPRILTTFSEAAVFRVGDVVPCDGDDGQGPVADCHGAAATPGDAGTVRFDYPAARYDPAAGGSGLPHSGAAFAALDATTDVVCFFLPESMQGDPGYRSAELNQCYELVAVSSSEPRFLRLDVTQSVRNQPGYPLARKRIHELELAAPVATAGRTVSLAPDTISADGELVARWLVFQGEDGRPLGRPQRILRSLDGGAGNDLFVIGDLRGAGESHVAGERVWISYGFASGDPFTVLVPVRIRSVSSSPGDTLLVTGDATLEMESVWLDGVKRVDARGDGQHRFERVWFRDPTPGQPGLDLDLHAFHLDHRDATNGRFRFRQVNVTGGDERGSVCGPARNTPCLHDAVHWGKATDLLLEDVSARYVGKGCFPGHGGDKSSSGTTLVRLSCEFVVDGALDGSLFAFDEGHESATIRDAFCGACGTDGDPIVWGVGAGGALTMQGVALWGGRSARLDLPQQNVVSDLFVAGTFSEFAPPTLPDRVDGFVHRENTVDALATSAELFGADAIEARNGVIRALAVRTLHLARPSSSLVLENLAFLDPIALRPARSVLGFVSAPQGTMLRRVLLWFTPGTQPLWTAGVDLAAAPASFTLDGFQAVHARGAFGPVLDLGPAAVAATSFGGGPCFHDVATAVQPGTESLYPPPTVWDAPPEFVDEARGNLLPQPGGVADAAGCGLDPLHPPGMRGKRFAHWLMKTSPELVGADADGDGVPEGAGAPCEPGQSRGCRDVCPGAFDPGQGDADGDGVGDACEAACRNGLDDDGDGLADLADPGCAGAGDESEKVLAGCSNGLDDDRDGLVDFGQDPGCGAPDDDLETSLTLACDDGRDNDGDDLADDADPGCPTGLALREDPACDDRFDNDGDGFVDFDDPQCRPGRVQSEHPRSSCGLGFEVAVALVGLYLGRRVRQRARPSSVAAAASAQAAGPGSGAKVRWKT